MVDPRGNRGAWFAKDCLERCAKDGVTVCVEIVFVGVKIFDFGLVGLGGCSWGVRIVVIEVVSFKPAEAKVGPDDDDQLC